MKVLLINASPNLQGNTALALQKARTVLEDQGVSCEQIEIGSELIHGCVACFSCFREQKKRCVQFTNDPVNDYITKMVEADGMVIGTPVYYSGINGTLKSFLDRAFLAASAGGSPLRHKVGLALAAVRRAGSLPALDQINKYFSISEMVIASGNYWTMVHGMLPNEAASDSEGLQTIEVAAANMAWLLKLMEYGRDAIPKPPLTKKIKTNFIR